MSRRHRQRSLVFLREFWMVVLCLAQGKLPAGLSMRTLYVQAGGIRQGNLLDPAGSRKAVNALGRGRKPRWVIGAIRCFQSCFSPVTCHFSLVASAPIRHNPPQRNTPDEAATKELEPDADSTHVVRSR